LLERSEEPIHVSDFMVRPNMVLHQSHAYRSHRASGLQLRLKLVLFGQGMFSEPTPLTGQQIELSPQECEGPHELAHASLGETSRQWTSKPIWFLAQAPDKDE
jgi:hypothetical protein